MIVRIGDALTLSLLSATHKRTFLTVIIVNVVFGSRTSGENCQEKGQKIGKKHTLNM